MQTFLPYPEFENTAKCLWYRHLGKQRVECKQILNALQHGGGWAQHPATRMWRGHAFYLWRYYNAICFEWVKRGYRHEMRLDDATVAFAHGPIQTTQPPWLGDELLHHAYKIALLHKKPEHYTPIFNPTIFSGWLPHKVPYVWPVQRDGTLIPRIQAATIDALFSID